MKKVAIVQSNYIPWKGYFDLISAVDEFIIYDDMQYTRRDWRNRNKIKTPHGLRWLTVPVQVKGKYFQRIRETEIDGDQWQKEHWQTIKTNYGKSEYFKSIALQLEPLYLEETYTHLSVLNLRFIHWVCERLAINTKIRDCCEYELVEGKTERLLSLCQQAKATEYISGPAAKGYLDESLFSRAGIGVTFFDYSNYPVYPQLWGEFEHGVTILDLLFNCGLDAPKYMKYVER